MHQTSSPDQAVSGAPGNTNLYVLDVMRRAEQELRQLIEKRAEISKRIGTVQRTMVGLAKLFGDDILRADLLHLFARERGTRQAGITWACRKTLMEARRPMRAHDLCEEIQRTAPALLANHKHPTASMTTILRRLVDYGEAKAMPGDDGQCAWLWVAERDSRSIQKTDRESDGSYPGKSVTHPARE
ncbi:MAG TPA: hypothetical protein VH350_13845 [Candidatus Sulfotelmatobacter sp.]|jgi:hypothetical protein|nr:hypothetical protein [Candidatus Sulfotelmatobacter sp.]